MPRYHPETVDHSTVHQSQIEYAKHHLRMEPDKDLRAIAYAIGIERRNRVVEAMKKNQPPFGVIEDFTCDTCLCAPLCLFAFDPYNTDGDCLANK